ncbi:hypothetical protein [Pseudidiomarina woesei]|uniref:Nitrate/nitrite transporter NarK n=1 Tax=Pseudidiomarina woesei TaxID=1381080 RepID=A0A0K6H5F7_9GAMM|nr:hypothetical protein [Pseudidiomarina woesei]CUA86219.1 Nitrate/nitrite transporter NarK [Pseudidiomarina woesei]
MNTVRVSSTVDKPTAINLIVGMALWMSLSVLVVQLFTVDAGFTFAQLYRLLAISGLSATICHFVFFWLGERAMQARFIYLTTAALVIPAGMTIWVFSNPPLSYTELQWLAAAYGLGGAQFIAFTRSEKVDTSGIGWTLAVNAGVAGIGIVIAQAALPFLTSINLFGFTSSTAWTTVHGSGDIVGVIAPGTKLWLGNSGWLTIAAVILATVTWQLARPSKVPQAPLGSATNRAHYAAILRNKHTWLMTLLYVMAFGSFIGFTITFPLSLQTFSTTYSPSALTYAWIGPLLGVLARPFGGWLADLFGGAKVTLWCAIVLAISCVAAGVITYNAMNSPLPEQWFLGYLLVFLVIFIATGAASSAIFRSVSVVLPLDQLPLALRWLTTIATAGAAYIPTLWYVNSTTQTPAYALFVFAAFYVVCAVLVSYMYLRNRAEFYNP